LLGSSCVTGPAEKEGVLKELATSCRKEKEEEQATCFSAKRSHLKQRRTSRLCIDYASDQQPWELPFSL
jgi:hypothetical protein